MLPAKMRRNNNPFISILVSALREENVKVLNFLPLGAWRADALHLHWLEQIFWGRVAARSLAWARFRGTRLLSLARAMRLRGRRVVWTVHNLDPHEFSCKRQERIYSKFRDTLMPLITDVICMSSEVEISVRERYPMLERANFHIIPHPHYSKYFEDIDYCLPSEAANFISNNDNIPNLTMIGMLRRYKGIPKLVNQLIATKAEFRLVIAGSGSKKDVSEIRDAIGEDSRVKLLPRRVDEKELVGLLKESDLAIFNFQKVLNSGSVLTALSLGTPVLAPRIGAIVDLEKQLSEPWLNTYESDELIERLSAVLRARPDRAARPDLSFCDPKHIAFQLKSVYSRP